MAGVRIELTGAEEALARLGDIAARAEHPRGLWDAIGAALVTSTQMRFERGEAPDGSPWPPSLRALAQGGKTLIDSARLFQSLTHLPSDRGVEVGTNVVYAASHQFGATISPKAGEFLTFKVAGQWARKRQVTIPARPFLGLDDDDEREVLQIAEEWIAGDPGSRSGAGEARP